MPFITSIIIGIICVVLGISHTKGNISTLHSYHRHRVSEEDRLPFGKMVGLGTIIIGVGVIIFGALSYLAEAAALTWLTLVSVGILIASFVVGMGITFYAMIKYNKGIF